MRTRSWFSIFVRVVTFVGALGSGTALGQERQHWMGEILLPNATCPRLVFAISLTRGAATAPAGWTGTMSIPRGCGILGVIDAPLKDVAVTDAGLAFSTLPPTENFYQAAPATGADAAAEPGVWKGSVLIAQTQRVPIRIWRATEAEARSVAPRRPQTPIEPLPYESREVQVPIRIGASDAALAGTLTVPAGTGPFPGVVLVTDEEGQDRDHGEGTHKMFLVLADRLTRAGYAVLRCDDRGFGGSGGSAYDSTLEEAAGDVGAQLAFLRTQPGVDPARLGVLGRGEGALVGAIAAGLDQRAVAFLVLLGPSGHRGVEAACLRERRQSEALGIGATLAQARVERLRKVLEATATGQDGDLPALQTALREDMRASAKEMRGMATPITPDQLEMYVSSRLDVLQRPRFRSWLALDPAGVYSKVACPTLVIGGGLDLVCPEADEIPAVLAALRAGPASARVESKVLAGVNHWMQPATTGFPDETDLIETTIDERVLADVLRFLGAMPRATTAAP
jgi:pimeloyl-ACP methyl ester carboxylesterase